MKAKILLYFFLLCLSSAFAQYSYWVQFKDKNGTSGNFSNPLTYLSEKAMQRRIKQNIPLDSTDLPVSRNYVEQVLSKGVLLKTSSKWLNGITVSAVDTFVINQIRQLPFIKQLELTGFSRGQRRLQEPAFQLKADVDTLYGSAYWQIDMHNGRKLHDEGFKGKGITIAVLDGGFYKMDEMAVFDRLIADNRLLGVKNFADTVSSFFSIPESHGTNVLSVMGAYLPRKMIGTAPEASYWLIRTEYSPSEYLVETDNWVAGAEFADSVGVDIINSSLSYTEFDDSKMNFTYQSLNGKTSRASLAANMASRKGIIVVSAAGNEGNKPWHYISTPSDADSILSVGAVNLTGDHVSFSSYGPAADGRIKPDVCAMGNQTVIANYAGIHQGVGTSYASPVIAGLTACVWQSLPNKNNMEIINLMKRYSSSYLTPNNSLGYGIPDVYTLYNENRATGISDESEVATPMAYFVGSNLVISTEINSSAILYGIMGVKVGGWHIQENINVTNWSLLPKGTYILVVESNFSRKVIKLRKNTD